MDTLPGWAMFALYWIVPLFLLAVAYRLWLRLFGVLVIPEDSIGIVNKKFVLFGEHRTLPDGAIIALHGEAGIQADTSRPACTSALAVAVRGQVRKFVTIRRGRSASWSRGTASR